MESQCKTHGLTPSREVGPTACRCCAAPCRRWRRYQYSIIRHASQGCCCLAGRFFVDAARQKHVVGANSVRPWAFGQCAAMARRWMQRKLAGERCSPLHTLQHKVASAILCCFHYYYYHHYIHYIHPIHYITVATNITNIMNKMNRIVNLH